MPTVRVPWAAPRIPGTTVVDTRINGSITVGWEIPAGYDAEKGAKLIQGAVVGQGALRFGDRFLRLPDASGSVILGKTA